MNDLLLIRFLYYYFIPMKEAWWLVAWLVIWLWIAMVTLFYKTYC